MEEILNHVLERLSNPEVLFGLAVRFFGVFAVLIIVMIVLQLTGWFFQRLERKAEGLPSPAGSGPGSRSISGPGTHACTSTWHETESWLMTRQTHQKAVCLRK